MVGRLAGLARSARRHARQEEAAAGRQQAEAARGRAGLLRHGARLSRVARFPALRITSSKSRDPAQMAWETTCRNCRSGALALPGRGRPQSARDKLRDSNVIALISPCSSRAPPFSSAAPFPPPQSNLKPPPRRSPPRSSRAATSRRPTIRPSWTAAMSSSRASRSRGRRRPTPSRFDEVVIESPTDSDNGVFESPKITFTGGTLSPASRTARSATRRSPRSPSSIRRRSRAAASAAASSSTPPRRPT